MINFGRKIAWSLLVIIMIYLIISIVDVILESMTLRAYLTMIMSTWRVCYPMLFIINKGFFPTFFLLRNRALWMVSISIGGRCSEGSRLLLVSDGGNFIVHGCSSRSYGARTRALSIIYPNFVIKLTC